MRAELDLPEGDGNLYVFRNFELVARKMVARPWEIKTAPCSHCGRCCKSYHDRKGLLPTGPDGCRNLEQRDDGTYWCAAHIPMFCLIANSQEPECTVRWSYI